MDKWHRETKGEDENRSVGKMDLSKTNGAWKWDKISRRCSKYILRITNTMFTPKKEYSGRLVTWTSGDVGAKGRWGT